MRKNEVADLKKERKSETCIDVDKFVAKYRDIGTPLISINVVKIYCRVVNSIYILQFCPEQHISLPVSNMDFISLA